MTIDELIQYFYDTFGNSKVLVRVSGSMENRRILEEAKITLYTDTNQYTIVANSGTEYIGCTMSSRKQRPGETWFRGRDLPDGKLNKKTIRTIINAIIKNELQDISKTSQTVKTRLSYDESLVGVLIDGLKDLGAAGQPTLSKWDAVREKIKPYEHPLPPTSEIG